MMAPPVVLDAVEAWAIANPWPMTVLIVAALAFVAWVIR